MAAEGGKHELPNRPPRGQGGVPVISFFCGAGGLDIGFEAAGFQTVFAADLMPAAIESYNQNAEWNAGVVADLLGKMPAHTISLIDERARSLGVQPRGLIGGPPCQGVSAANTQSGPKDPRNKLFARYCTLVSQLEEKYGLDFFVLENVPGLKAKKNQSLYSRLQRNLSRKFELHECVLDASEHGVPQTRRRLFIVGFNRKLKVTFKFPEPIAGDAPTVEDAIKGFAEPEFFLKRGETPRSRVHANHWTMQPVSKKFGRNKKRNGRDGRSFKRLDWNKPSLTVAYGHREIHVHPDGHRRLSIFEAMLLQGFPKRYELIGSLSDQVTQVSNAVPPPLAKAVARCIAESLQSAEPA